MPVSINVFRGRGSRLPARVVSPSPLQNKRPPIPARVSEVNGFVAPRLRRPTRHCGFSLLHAFVELATMGHHGRPAGKGTRQLMPSALWPLAHYTLDGTATGPPGRANADGGREGHRVRWRAPIEYNASCEPQGLPARAWVPVGLRSHRRPGPLVPVPVQATGPGLRLQIFPA